MFVPFFSEPRLVRRKGGGKSASTSKSSSSSSLSSSSSSKSSTSGSTPKSSSSKSKPFSWSSKKSTTKYSTPKAAPVISTIPAGQLFAGRLVGGGTRSGIFGTKAYGSGYPGVLGRGTAGRGFPFFFWPLAWPLTVGAGVGTAAYLHNNHEYGDSTNSSRPGGPLSYAVFQSAYVDNNSFRIFADNETVVSLMSDLRTNCSSRLSSTSVQGPLQYTNDATNFPQPENVIQYYRASSLALTFDGYNNSAATYAVQEGSVGDLPLPGTMDVLLLDCLNQTIGLAAPLIDGANLQFQGNIGLLGVFWVLWFLFGNL